MSEVNEVSSATPQLNQSGDGASPSPNKKRKMDDQGKIEDQVESTTENSGIPVLKDFKLVKVLREDDRHKFICLHGKLPSKKDEEVSESTDTNQNDDQMHNKTNSEQDAVVLLNKKSFDVSTIEESVRLSLAEETLKNDVYSSYDMLSGLKKADLRATLIFPATAQHISKYSAHEPFIVHETPQLYKDVTLPCLEAGKFSVQWVYNILSKKQEADRIVVEDADPETGFVMVPDLKWDREKLESLYLVAITHNSGLKSLRDLRGEHLPLLQKILDKGVEAIQRLYNIGPDKLRIYFHYQPSYYHLHVHFTHLQFDAPGSDVLRAHLINDVIDNLTLDPEFYAKKTLSYVVREGDPLYKSYTESGYFSKSE